MNFSVRFYHAGFSKVPGIKLFEEIGKDDLKTRINDF